jgi:hypothetical protein
MQLIAGRTAQEYNQRKARGGAFWEDRYHATAIEPISTWIGLGHRFKPLFTQVRPAACLRSRWLNYRQRKVLCDESEVRVFMEQRSLLLNRQSGNQAINGASNRESSSPQAAVDICSR